MIKLFEEYNDIDSICIKYFIDNYTINPDGSIDVNGDVDLSGRKLDSIPLKFGIVNGHFDCSYNQLTTLEGCPNVVNGNFSCNNNKLTSLEGCPKEVGMDFNCYFNQLKSLKGPRDIGENFMGSAQSYKLPDLIYNNIEHIKDIIKYQDDYSIWNNDGSLNEYRFKDMMEEIITIN